MFEHVRTTWTAEHPPLQAAVQAATTARDAAAATLEARRAALPGLQAAVDGATATLNARNGELAAAQTVVNQRAAVRQAAQAALDQARQKLSTHLDNEPPETGARDKPNPAWGVWNRKRQQLEQKVAEAQATLDATAAPLLTAQQARDGAAGAVGAASAALDSSRNTVTAATAEIPAAEQRLATAESSIVAAQQAVDALTARIAGLDARATRLSADPLDRAVLEPAADAELADLHAAWRRRHDLYGQRGAAAAERADQLAQHDRTMADLAVLRSQIAGWADFGRWAPLAGVVAVFDTVVQANSAQRGRGADVRDDDLPTAQLQLAAQIVELAQVAQKALAERDGAGASLAAAAEALTTHQKKAP